MSGVGGAGAGSAAGTGRARPRRRILLADDDPSYAEALAALLRGAGFAVEVVRDGEAAVQRLAAAGSAYDLVVCDLLMPRRTGFEVVKEAMAMGVLAPILALTGVYDDMREIHALRGLGVAGYVHKSSPLDHVLFRVGSLLRPERAPRRRDSRVAAAVPVRFRHAGEVAYGTTYNLCVSGLYVRTPESPPAGAEVEIGLSLPTAEETLEGWGEVVHAATLEEVKGTGYPAGFGVRLIAWNPLAQAALRHFVATLLRQESTGEGLGTVPGRAATAPGAAGALDALDCGADAADAMDAPGCGADAPDAPDCGADGADTPDGAGETDEPVLAGVGVGAGAGAGGRAGDGAGGGTRDGAGAGEPEAS